MDNDLNYLELIKLIKNKQILKYKGVFQYWFLNIAVESGHKDVIEFLISKGLNPSENIHAFDRAIITDKPLEYLDYLYNTGFPITQTCCLSAIKKKDICLINFIIQRNEQQLKALIINSVCNGSIWFFDMFKELSIYSKYVQIIKDTINTKWGSDDKQISLNKFIIKTHLKLE